MDAHLSHVVFAIGKQHTILSSALVLLVCNNLHKHYLTIMDVVWLKRDVRLHDHAPLAQALSSSRPFLLLYLYEPSQLSHPTVHGSHIYFSNEGLLAFSQSLSQRYQLPSSPLTILYLDAVPALTLLQRFHPIARILAHQETGHLDSFARDVAVRSWCRQNSVSFIEYQASGAIRGLKNRDDYARLNKKFMNAPLAQLPHPTNLFKRLRVHQDSCGIVKPEHLEAIHSQHRADRVNRQRGGEQEGLRLLMEFLTKRGEKYSTSVSAPLKAWKACSRLSPYLAWGHMSLRFVIQEVQKRQMELRARQKVEKGDPWLKSMAAVQSRLRWRSHFVQKLESQPDMERRAQCGPLDTVRCADGDWNETRYLRWKEGRTGFPMVDAVMRCLLCHGWVNFRMRAMLVSFACYNLWLDWRGISSHLARCFLDYEPGIHYPQLQMQAGVTGINTMRVYGVVKQGYDQDADGLFVRTYVEELRGVEKQFVHEPWRMSKAAMKKAGVLIGGSAEEAQQLGLMWYPARIVEEKAAAKDAKSRMQKLRQQKVTKEEARKVYEKLGSRRGRQKRKKVGNTVEDQVRRKVKRVNTLDHYFSKKPNE